MNERMLELYKQAHVPDIAIDPSNNMPYDSTRFSAEKFTELIVKECAEVIQRPNTYEATYLSIAGNQIKEHFGAQ